MRFKEILRLIPWNTTYYRRYVNGMDQYRENGDVLLGICH